MEQEVKKMYFNQINCEEDYQNYCEFFTEDVQEILEVKIKRIK